MNLIRRYNKLSIWKKLAFWGSMASIIGLLYALFVKTSTQSNTQQIISSPGSIQAGRDIVIQPNITFPETGKNDDSEKKIKTSKLKIHRLIEDFDSQLESIKREYQKENVRIVSKFSARGMAASGEHIGAQMEYARNTKDSIANLLTTLNRNIEDILLENFNIRTLEENDTFKSESILLNREKAKVKKAYKYFEDTVKDWEKRCTGNSRSTKDFKL